MFCFTIGGKKYCIAVPLLIWRWPWPPNGDPWKHLGDWVQDENPNPQPWRVNVPILATVAELAKHAQGDLQGRLQQLVHAETAELKRQLPEGTTLELR